MEKDGLTYKLAEGEKLTDASENSNNAERIAKLEALGAELWVHAEHNDGAFPVERDTATVRRNLWIVPHPSGLRYQYVPGLRTARRPPVLLAVEPDLFAGDRYGLFTDGRVRAVTAAEVEAAFGDKDGSR